MKTLFRSCAALLILTATVFTLACNTSELDRAKKFSKSAVIAVRQGPTVIDTLLAAGKLTAEQAEYYRGLLNRVGDSLSETNARIQELTAESPNTEVVATALHGSIDLINTLLGEVAARADNASGRVSAILIIVRGFLSAALGYLETSKPLDLKQSDLDRLERLCDPGVTSAE